ncbi:hypothetical protein RB213_015538 [Colletotrichum asianum]
MLLWLAGQARWKTPCTKASLGKNAERPGPGAAPGDFLGSTAFTSDTCSTKGWPHRGITFERKVRLPTL